MNFGRRIALLTYFLLMRTAMCMPGFTVSNILVSRNNISLDSVSRGRYYFSGIVTYDLNGTGQSIPIHAYIEELPYQRFQIGSAILSEGRGTFTNIDSLCSGDIGWVSPGFQKRIIWHYSTSDTANHCRIKIGGANFHYAVVTEKRPDQQIRYLYDNRGLVREMQTFELPDMRLTGSVEPLYNSNGQLIVNDKDFAEKPYLVSVYEFSYDDYSRWNRRGYGYKRDGQWFELNYWYAYEYDSQSHCTQISHIFLDGQDSFKVTLGYDRYSRFDHSEELAVRSNSTLVLKEEHYYYRGTDTTFLDSMACMIYDTNLTEKLTVSEVTKNDYNIDSTIHSTISVSRGIESDYYREHQLLYFYDDDKNHLFTISKTSFSPDSLSFTVDTIDRKIYDQHKNIISTDYWQKKFNVYGYTTGYYGPPGTPVDSTNGTEYMWQLFDLDTLPDIEND